MKPINVLTVCLIMIVIVACATPSQKGFKAYTQQKYDKSINFYTKAIDAGDLSKQELADAYIHRGNARRFTGEYDLAIIDLTKALELNPVDDGFSYRSNIKDVYLCRGLAFGEKGDYDHALEDYNSAIKIDPQYGVLYTYRGDVWSRKGNYYKAIEDYNRAIDIWPDEPDAYSRLAWLLSTCPDNRFRDGRRSVEMAKKAIHLTKWEFQNSQHFSSLAAAYAEVGEFEKAVESQETAIEICRKYRGKKNWRV